MRSTVATTALKICLCSDTAGATPVDEFILPALGVINVWYPITVNKGSALGASIKSVALYAIVDPGSPVITIDNVIACKATASADSLSLKSLISKNSAAMGGTHSWHGIQSINGTTVMLDNGPATNAELGEGYSGTTEHIATYKRETLAITTAETPMETGVEGSPFEYQGGFNTATNLVDGETFLDGVNGNFNGLTLTSRDWHNISGLSFVRCATGVYISTVYNCALQFGSLINNASYGVHTASSVSAVTITARDVCNNSDSGFYLGSSSFVTGIFTSVNNNLGQGCYYTTASLNRLTCTTIKNNSLYGLYSSAGRDLRASISTANNTSGGVYSDSGNMYLNKSTLAETPEVTLIATAYHSVQIFSTLHDNTAQNNKIWADGYTVTSQSAVRQTVSGVAWKLSPTSARRNSFYPVVLSIAKIAVDSGSAITVNAFFLRDSVDITGKLVCRGGQLSGLTSDVTDTITAGINTWEELSISFTPTESGVVEIEAWAYGGTTNSVYVDSIRMS
jgi:hypothetical protein